MKKTHNILFIISLYFLASSSVFAQSIYKPVEKNKKFPVTGANDFAPVVVRDGVVFCSDKTLGGIQILTDINGQRMSNIYFTELSEDGKWGPVKDFALELRTTTHDGPISFNKNEDMAVFSRNYKYQPGFGSDKGGNPNAGLFFAKYDGSKWTNVDAFEHNNIEFVYTHPSLSSTGDTLYFASNDSISAFGNFGGYDIYVSYRDQVDGSWTVPKNLGPVVNTSANEIYPHLHASGRLYFSSDGHRARVVANPDYDIFYSDFFNKKWFKPIPSPLNSNMDDFTYYTDKNYEKVLLTSNRNSNRKDPKLSIFEFESRYPEIGIANMQVENNYCYIFFEENTVSLDTNLYIYEWKMGDGSKVQAIEAEHCYKEPGDYLIELNVVDKLTGVVEFNQAEYLVEVRKIIQPYIIVLDSTFSNEVIHFDGRESFLGDQDLRDYDFVWDFGDGGKFGGPTANHIFKTPGDYNIKLGLIEKGSKSQDLKKYGAYIVINVLERKQP